MAASLLIMALVFGLLIVGIAVASARGMAARMNDAWSTAAAMLRFSFEPGGLSHGPRLAGDIGDHPAAVETSTRSSGGSSTRYTRYSIAFPPLGIGLNLSQQTGFDGVLKVLGFQDIEIGHPVFDAAFVVKADSPKAAREVLTAGRRLALNRLLAVHPEVVVRDDGILLERRGVERDADVIVSTVRRLASVAQVLTEADDTEALDALAEARLGGDVPYASEPGDETSIDERIGAGEALMVSGLADAAKAVFDALAAELPADPEVRGWSTQAAKRRLPPDGPPNAAPLPEVEDRYDHPVTIGAPTPAAEEAPAPEETHRDAIDQIAVAADLFGERRLSFETAARFDEEYAGITVEWSGRIRSSTTVERDRVLGDGPMTKAVIDVASLENDLFGNTVVSAVVAFPPERHFSPGTEITFTGELTAVDGLVRNLYVSNGRLV